MDIFLRTNSDSKRLEFRSIRKTEKDYACFLIIESRGFSASRSFYFDDYHLTTFVESLNMMEPALEGEATLRHSFEEDRILFKVLRNGHIIVSGSLVEHSECTQQLDFCFQTDQTVLRPLLQEFGKLKSGGECKDENAPKR
jgi:hypothetical protein